MSFRNDMIVFIATVGERLETIPKLAAHDVVVDVRKPVRDGGNMPVRRGNLRNSLEASTSRMPGANYQPDANELLRDPMREVTTTIGSLKPRQKLYLGFRAAYAPVQELKHGFVRLTELKWQSFVDRAAALAEKLHP